MATKYRRALRGLAAAVGAAATLALVPGVASATPVRGYTGWSVLLCKFHDNAATPKSPGWISQFTTPAGNGMGGLADYWRAVSYGRITLQGSTVHGWYTMP